VAVKLKGEFDNRLRNSGNNLRQFQQRLLLEKGKPKVWSPAQVDDLFLIFNAIADLGQAVSELANQIRDD
jgi:hypothetical protein